MMCRLNLFHHATQSYYLDTELTSPCPILKMLSARLGVTSINFKVLGLTWSGFWTRTRDLRIPQSPRTGGGALLIQPPRLVRPYGCVYIYIYIYTLIFVCIYIITCLLFFYVLATSKVISGWVPTCDCEIMTTFIVLPQLWTRPSAPCYNIQLSHSIMTRANQSFPYPNNAEHLSRRRQISIV